MSRIGLALVGLLVGPGIGLIVYGGVADKVLPVAGGIVLVIIGCVTYSDIREKR